MRLLNIFIAGAVALLLSGGVMWAQSTQLAPAATVTTLTGTTSSQVIGTNPSRKAIQICNVGTTIVWIAPTGVSPISAYELPALASGTTTCYPSSLTFPPATANSPGQSWNAVVVGGSSGGTVSVFEY